MNLKFSKKIKRVWKKINKPLRVAAKVLEWIIFAVLILIFLAVLSPVLPTKKYLSTFIVASGSMQPTIKTGSIAIVQPVKYQEVIALRYFEGKDNKEIAEILNINEGTLKSLLSRGIEKLRVKCNQF